MDQGGRTMHVLGRGMGRVGRWMKSGASVCVKLGVEPRARWSRIVRLGWNRLVVWGSKALAGLMVGSLAQGLWGRVLVGVAIVGEDSLICSIRRTTCGILRAC